MSTKSYTEARAHLAELMDQVTQDREPVVITRRGHEPVALIAADELDSLIETIHLLRSRTNAERLLSALARAKARESTPDSLNDEAAARSDLLRKR
jgi:antitoxin YefM